MKLFGLSASRLRTQAEFDACVLDALHSGALLHWQADVLRCRWELARCDSRLLDQECTSETTATHVQMAQSFNTDSTELPLPVIPVVPTLGIGVQPSPSLPRRELADVEHTALPDVCERDQAADPQTPGLHRNADSAVVPASLCSESAEVASGALSTSSNAELLVLISSTTSPTSASLSSGSIAPRTSSPDLRPGSRTASPLPPPPTASPQQTYAPAQSSSSESVDVPPLAIAMLPAVDAPLELALPLRSPPSPTFSSARSDISSRSTLSALSVSSRAARVRARLSSLAWSQHGEGEGASAHALLERADAARRRLLSAAGITSSSSTSVHESFSAPSSASPASAIRTAAELAHTLDTIATRCRAMQLARAENSRANSRAATPSANGEARNFAGF